MTNPERIITTRCVMPHKRAREPGEVYLLADGTETTAEGGEKVWDYERIVAGAWDQALLCTGHLARLRQIVARTPAMVVWLREHVQPGSVALDPDTPKHAPGPRSPAPLRLEAVDAADEEVATLASWAMLAVEESGVEGPDLSETWMVPPSLRVDDIHRVNVRGPGRVAGLRVKIEPVDDITRWMLDRLDWIAEQPWVDEMLTELAKVRGTNMARWPLEDRSRPLAGYSCIRCESRTLVWHPPASPGWPIAILCGNSNCGYSIPEDQWHDITERLEQHRGRMGA